MNDIHRQIGEVVATQQAFRETLQEIKSAIEAGAAERRAYEAEIRHGHDVLSQRVMSMEHTTVEQHRWCSDRFKTVTRDIAAMQEPVAQFVTMRDRVSRLTLVLLSIAGVVWALAEPIYQLVIARALGTHKS
jgi:hypothetical protein